MEEWDSRFLGAHFETQIVRANQIPSLGCSAEDNFFLVEIQHVLIIYCIREKEFEGEAGKPGICERKIIEYRDEVFRYQLLPRICGDSWVNCRNVIFSQKIKLACGILMVPPASFNADEDIEITCPVEVRLIDQNDPANIGDLGRIDHRI